MIAGWGRAILLLQLAHPAGVAAGVNDHSSFAAVSYLRFGVCTPRWARCSPFTFGDTEQMITAAARVNAIHDRVRGRVHPPSGQAYWAHDPELQRWVHATLIDSIPMTTSCS